MVEDFHWADRGDEKCKPGASGDETTAQMINIWPEEQDWAFLFCKGSSKWSPNHNAPFLVQKSSAWIKSVPASRQKPVTHSCSPSLQLKRNLQAPGNSHRQKVWAPLQKGCILLSHVLSLTHQGKKNGQLHNSAEFSSIITSARSGSWDWKCFSSS